MSNALDTVISRYKAGIEKLLNKSFDLSDNTLTGTVAQFKAAGADFAAGLTTVAKKTANYTGGPNQIVPMDASGGAVTFTFPTAPADGTREIVKKVDSSTNAVNLALGGSDVFNVAGGVTTGSLVLQNQAIQAQYDAARSIWYVISTDAPLSGLDARYNRPTKFLSTFGRDPAWAGVVLSSIGGTNTGAPSVNGGLAARLLPETDLAVSNLVWVVNTQSGNYDIAILDASGNRLWSKGSTAVPASGTVVTETVTGVTFRAGAWYYVLWSADNTTAGVRGLSIANQGTLQALTDGTGPVLSIASVFNVTTTPVTLGSTVPNRLPFFAVRGT